MDRNREIFAPPGHKVMLAISAIFFGGVCLLGLWLWKLEHMTFLFVIAFGLLSAFYGFRLRAVMVNPVIIVHGSILRVLKWAGGGYQEIDMRTAMDTAIADDQIIIKQNRVGVGISKGYIGKAHFDELACLIRKNRVNE